MNEVSQMIVKNEFAFEDNKRIPPEIMKTNYI